MRRVLWHGDASLFSLCYERQARCVCYAQWTAFCGLGCERPARAPVNHPVFTCVFYCLVNGLQIYPNLAIID